jgi:hypothetical protein
MCRRNIIFFTNNGSQIEIDADDYFEVWQSEFGQIVSGGNSAADASLSDAAIPEPGSIALFLFGALLWSAWRPRGTRSLITDGAA